MAETGPAASVAANWRADVPASIVSALVALPLCLGVAVASGAPPIAGLIAGIVGGLLVGALSRSPLSVSGPAAGMTAIVFSALQTLPSYGTFLLVVCLAGLIQLVFSVLRGGALADLVPPSVVIGMLAAIGLILILRQLPYAVGHTGYGEARLAALWSGGASGLAGWLAAAARDIVWGSALVAALGLVFLFWWDGARPQQGLWRLLPGPLVVVLASVALNGLFRTAAPALVMTADQLVKVPVATSPEALAGLLLLPEFGAIGSPEVWTLAVTLAIVASLETLLSIKAVDLIDPLRRVTDRNRELLAQGFGNLASGLAGGLPVTSVIVRSSANVEAGARTRASTILHGGWLLLAVLLIPAAMNLIPLAALAAVLLNSGYKLAKPSLFVTRWRQGWAEFLPFLATVVAILLTDLLIGIVTGLIVYAASRAGRWLWRGMRR